MIKVSKTSLFAIVAAVVAILFVFMAGSIWEDTDKSKNYVCQYPITGEYVVWTDGGLKSQYFGNVYEYSKTSQIEFIGCEQNAGGYVASGENPAAAVTFNDNGKGMIVGSFRVVMPLDEQNMMKIQRDFGSEKALINNLVRPTLYKVIISCGPLMSSLESVSASRTDLIEYITDQLNNGVYKTKSTKVEAVNELTGDKEIRTQVTIQRDTLGNYLRQEVSPFSQYGITCGLVSITDIKYDAATQSQIDAQKEANLAVITSKTRSIEAMQKAIQAAEQGKAEAEKARWEQEKIKVVEVTKAQQEYEVAKLAADKAIQEARKIEAEGRAKAEANRLLVQAGLTPLERATIEKETAIGIAHELANSNVRWVPEIIMSGGNNGNSAMDAVGLNMMMDVVHKMNNKK